MTGAAGPPPDAGRDRGVLVGVDLAGIQRFVFEGRRLLDAIGRATLVADLTDTARPHLKSLLADPATGANRVLRDAGGALYIAFTDPTPGGAARNARTFTGRYTRRLRDVSDQLSPVVAHIAYGPDPDTPGAPATQGEALKLLPVALQQARSRLTAAHQPVPGLGVTALCDVTGRPAELLDHTRDRGPVRERAARDIVAARVRARRWHQDNSTAWLRGIAAPAGFDHLELPTDVDHLGREIGDISRLAVIHLDFNGLGDLLKRYHRACADSGADVVAAMRRVSADIARLTDGLARAIIRSVAAAIDTDRAGGDPVITGAGAGTRLRPRTDRRTVYVPVRPVVVAGDDLTIICDARLAWSVTRFALSWLDTDPAGLAPTDPRAPMAARAGQEPWGRIIGGAGNGTGATSAGTGSATGAHSAEWGNATGVSTETATGVPSAGSGAPSAGSGIVTGVPSAGIGIAVQPVGAPLSVGYDICAALCERAKEHRKAAEHRRDDHVVAWSHLFDAPARVLARLEDARNPAGAVPPLTTLPMTGAEFHAFLGDYLDDSAPRGLRAPAMAAQRSWLLSRLEPLLRDGLDPAPELARRRDLGLPARLPEPFDRAALLDALSLLDIHLDVPLADPPVPARAGAR
ncbi:hypothetical protein ACFOVU_01020 [Nocardiopsis sediminis]|uniref:Guanylate cyclase domain-containing protein n=1 Tax=Nocardiopsis sediminis TaxID=1778267 RepID=A0ABV8FEJ1_9ACTN